MKKRLLVPLILFLAFVFGCVGVFLVIHRGRFMTKIQMGNSSCSVRLSEYEQRPLFMGLSKYRYLFESCPAGSSRWREIAEYSTDDDIGLSQESIRFLDNRVAFVWAFPLYAISTNAGRTWTVWRPEERLHDWESSRPFIKEVRVNSDGRGSLSLASGNGRALAVDKLSTDDYGVSWRPAK